MLNKFQLLLNIKYLVPLTLGSCLLLIANPFFANNALFPAVAAIWIVYVARQMKLSLYANVILNLLANFAFAGLAFKLVINANQYAPNISSGQVIQFSIIITTLFLLFWVVTLNLINKISNKWSHLLIFGIVISIIVISFKPNLFMPIKLFLQTVTFLNFQNMYYFMVEIVDKRNSKQAISLATAIAPFWNPGPIPFECKTDLNSDEKQLKIMYSGIYLLLYIIIARYIIIDNLYLLAKNNHIIKIALENLPQMLFIELRQFTYFYSELSIEWWEHWIIVVGGFALRIFRLSISTAYIVAVARLCGLPVLQFIQNPFNAKSFYELVTKINYHYVYLIKKLVMNPFVTTLTLIKSAYLRTAVVVFTSVFIFGFIFHLLRYPHVFLKISILDYSNHYLGYSFYFFLLATLCAFSAYFSLRKLENKTQKLIARVFKNIFYLLIYAIIFSLIGPDYFWTTPEIHLFFTLSLFDFYKTPF